jgi:hypothetical protein
MGKNQDPGSGINIPETQHCYLSLLLRSLIRVIPFSNRPDPEPHSVRLGDPDPPSECRHQRFDGTKSALRIPGLAIKNLSRLK